MDTRNGDIYASRELAEAVGVPDEDLVTGSRAALEKLAQKLKKLEERGSFKNLPEDARTQAPKCGLCGEPMPAGEEMFKFHGYSGPCPKPIAIKSMQPDQSVRLRAALVGLVGVDGREELEQMEAVIRQSPAPDDDKVAALNGIHALLATLPPETPR